jgi:type I restriction enzyme, S subunit
MANGLPVVPLGEFLTQRKEFFTIDDFVKYKRARVQSHGQGIILRDEVYGSEIKTKKQQAARTGEFLVAEIDAKVGGFGIVLPELDGAVVSSHYFLFQIDENKCSKEWLNWFVRFNSFEEQTKAQGSTNYAAIRPNDVLNFEIPLPPLTEQRRIVAHIESLAARVHEAQRLREEIAENLNAFVESYHVNYSDRVVRLGDILYLDEDKESIQPESSYPQIGVKGFGKGLFARETVSGSQTTYRWFNRLYYGAVVLSQVKGWEGAIGVVDESLVGKFASPEYRTFRCKPDQALPEYLSELIATPWFYLQLKTLSRGVGGRRERIRPELFIELEIPMPDIERQRQAVEIFAKFPALRELQAESGKELSALMPSILDKAFKGEL